MKQLETFRWASLSVLAALLIGVYVEFIATGPINLQPFQVVILFVGWLTSAIETGGLWHAMSCIAGFGASLAVVYLTP